MQTKTSFKCQTLQEGKISPEFQQVKCRNFKEQVHRTEALTISQDLPAREDEMLHYRFDHSSKSIQILSTQQLFQSPKQKDGDVLVQKNYGISFLF